LGRDNFIINPQKGNILRVREFSLKKIEVGHRFSPLIYQISEDLIIKYAQAVDDPNPLYDCPHGSTSRPFQGMIAPPTIASLFVLKGYRTDRIPPPGGIHLKQKFMFFGLMRPGDVLSVQTELNQKVKRKGGWYLTFVSHAKNQKGEIVLWSESTSVRGDLEIRDDKNRGRDGVTLIPSLPFHREVWRVNECTTFVLLSQRESFFCSDNRGTGRLLS
jgi:acyl dehydratase